MPNTCRHDKLRSKWAQKQEAVLLDAFARRLHMDWDLPKPKSTVAVGDDLSKLSISELAERVDALKAEITRTEAMAAEKRRHTAAADALFGKTE
jgi:uncharacterized small protein (DUF1192 family)